jgi:hypothetical protein
VQSLLFFDHDELANPQVPLLSRLSNSDAMPQDGPKLLKLRKQSQRKQQKMLKKMMIHLFQNAMSFKRSQRTSQSL